MITEFMVLKTKTDAEQWASDFELDDYQTKMLAKWLWAEKPFIGCSWNEHPISNLSVDDLWDIL